MELMWLVYAVENFTYDGSSFLGVSLVLIFFSFVWWLSYKTSKCINPDQSGGKVCYKKYLPIQEGQTFILESEYLDLNSNMEYTAEYVWKHSNKLRIKGKVKDYILSDIENHQSYTIIEKDIKGFENKFPVPNMKLFATLIILFATLHVILPTKQTAIYMAGAYMLQQVVTHDKTKEIGDAAYRATMSQLNKWAEESPQLKDMLEDVVEKKVNALVEGENK